MLSGLLSASKLWDVVKRLIQVVTHSIAFYFGRLFQKHKDLEKHADRLERRLEISTRPRASNRFINGWLRGKQKK